MPGHEQVITRRPTLTVQAFWLMVAKTIGFGLTIVLPMLLVRIFDQKHYGVFRQAFVVIGTGYSLLNMGVAMSAFYYFPRKTEGRAQIALNVLAFNVACGIIPIAVLSFYPGILARIFGGPELVPYGRLIGLIMCLTLSSAFLETVATALQDVKRSTIFIVFAQLSKVVMMTSAALWLRSVEGLLYAAVAQGVLQSGILIWYLHHKFGRFWTSFDWRFFREQIGYALPYGLNGVLYSLQYDMHNYFVAHVFGPAAFAVYSVGCLQIPLLGLLRDSITSVLIAKTSELQHLGKRREILTLTARAMRKAAFIYLPAYALLIVVGRELLIFLYTRAYEKSWRITMINLTMLPFAVLINDPIIRAYAEHRYFVVKVRIALLCLQLATLWFFIERIGMTGAIGVMVSVGILERVLLTWRTTTLLGMRFRDIRLFRGIGALALTAAACAAATYGVKYGLAGAKPIIILLLCGTFFAALFAALTYFLGLLEPDEVELVRRYWSRCKLPAISRS
jgi:O-antigen/teichoic acid export membrane protein